MTDLRKRSSCPYISDGRKIVASGNSSKTASSPLYLLAKNWDPLGKTVGWGCSAAFSAENVLNAQHQLS